MIANWLPIRYFVRFLYGLDRTGNAPVLAVENAASESILCEEWACSCIQDFRKSGGGGAAVGNRCINWKCSAASACISLACISGGGSTADRPRMCSPTEL